MSMGKFNIEVASGNREKQIVVRLDVPKGCSVEQAIVFSGILNTFPDLPPIDSWQSLGFGLGIYSKRVDFSDLVEEGDRIEILWPLEQSAMDARRARVQAKKKKK